MLSKPKKIREVYFDHAATTYMKPEVLKAMQPFFIEKFGNPSSLYHRGREANTALNNARREIAGLVHALPENIIFTAGGTEADNLAVYGVAHAHSERGKHVISIAIEHHAILHPLEDLAKQGFEITYIKVDENGLVDPKEVVKALRSDTILVTIMYANNEIGSVEPVAEIGREILKYRKEKNSVYPFFHTDACQAAGYLDLDVEKLHVDLMTVNGSKIYGPKGVGFLYVRRGVKLKPILIGGSQERKTRAGTENVAGVVGLAEAFRLAQENRDDEATRVRELTSYLWNKLQEKITGLKLNGPEIGENRLPNNLNVTFIDIEGEAMLLYLDEYGIMCSTGSACTADSLDPSHVLMAIGLPYEYAHGSLRFTLGACNDKKDIDYMLEYLPAVVDQLREMSPVHMGQKPHARYK